MDACTLCAKNHTKANAHYALTRAYDIVEWNHLEAMLLKLAFSYPWVMGG
jgi:hypothetical protein